MKKSVLKKLNKINTKFYNDVSKDFDSSRQYFWEGWEILWEFIVQNSLPVYSILDIACGNARFYNFLQERLSALCLQGNMSMNYEGSIIHNGFAYTGIDNNQYLLTQGIFSSASDNDKTSAELFSADILNDDIEFEGKYDLVVSFGFLHHIPSFEKRLEFFIKLKSLINKDGLICISNWKFLDDEKEKKKIIEPEILNINSHDLEPNDFILTWNRGQKAYRYCHYTDTEELEKLLNLADLKLIKKFYSDGKSHKLNEYLILSI